VGATQYGRPVFGLLPPGGGRAMMRREYVYLSGPISARNGYSLEANVAAALDVYLECLRLGILAFCPHLIAGYPSHLGIPYDVWMEVDLATIDRCTALLMLDRWDTSPGAIREKAYAESKGLPVYFTVAELDHALIMGL
jgi:hypothetical protein